MTDKFYNNKFGDKPAPPWKHDWPSMEEQSAYWDRKEREEQGRQHDLDTGRMHRCPQCGCLFTGGEA